MCRDYQEGSFRYNESHQVYWLNPSHSPSGRTCISQSLYKDIQTERETDIQKVNKPFPNTLSLDMSLKKFKKTAGTEGD